MQAQCHMTPSASKFMRLVHLATHKTAAEMCMHPALLLLLSLALLPCVQAELAVLHDGTQKTGSAGEASLYNYSDELCNIDPNNILM